MEDGEINRNITDAGLASIRKFDPDQAWQPYRPSAEAPWDSRRVGHLYRRAAFGAARLSWKRR